MEEGYLKQFLFFQELLVKNQDLLLNELREFKQETRQRFDNLEADVTILKEGQANLEKGQINLEEGQANLEEGQASIRADIISLKEGQANLEKGQASIRADIIGLKMGQTNLKEGQAELMHEVRQNRFLIEEMRNNINLLVDGHRFTTEGIDKLRKRPEHKDDISVIKTVITQHSDEIAKNTRDIEELKKAR